MRSLNAEEATLDDFGRAIKNDPRPKWARNQDFLDSFFDSSKVYFLEKLLRYFRPEFDKASETERLAMLERTIEYVNEYLTALRRLTTFLQYGEPGAYEGLPTKPVTEAEKQVRAAELRELVRTERGDPLPYAKIGKLLGEKAETRASP